MALISKSLLAKLGKAALNVAGITGGGANDRAKLLEAQVQLLSLKVEISIAALEDVAERPESEVIAAIRDIRETATDALRVLRTK